VYIDSRYVLANQVDCPETLSMRWRDELAGGQIIQGAEAAGQLVVAQAVLAVQPA
jgi:hypothetical protein